MTISASKLDKVFSWAMIVFALVVLALIPIGVRAEVEGSVDEGLVSETLKQWELVVAFFIPWLTSVMIRNNFNQQMQSLTMLAVSLVVVLVTMFLNGTLDSFSDLLFSYMKVVAFTIAYYKGISKPTGISPTIQNSVNPGPA